MLNLPGRVTVQYSGPVGFQTLSETVGIEYFNRAVSLSLRGPTYTDAMIEQICKLDNLQSLFLSGTGITRRGLDRIRRALPNCKIEHYP